MGYLDSHCMGTSFLYKPFSVSKVLKYLLHSNHLILLLTPGHELRTRSSSTLVSSPHARLS